jgi:hypothetical protein
MRRPYGFGAHRRIGIGASASAHRHRRIMIDVFVVRTTTF